MIWGGLAYLVLLVATCMATPPKYIQYEVYSSSACNGPAFLGKLPVSLENGCYPALSPFGNGFMGYTCNKVKYFSTDNTCAASSFASLDLDACTAVPGTNSTKFYKFTCKNDAELVKIVQTRGNCTSPSSTTSVEFFFRDICQNTLDVKNSAKLLAAQQFKLVKSGKRSSLTRLEWIDTLDCIINQVDKTTENITINTCANTANGTISYLTSGAHSSMSTTISTMISIIAFACFIVY